MGLREPAAEERTLDNLGFARFGETMLLVENKRNPSPSEWSIWSHAYGRATTQHNVRSLLVVSEGGGPNAVQRREVVEALLRGTGTDVADTFRTAVCSDAPIARFISAAIGWLYANRGMSVFPYDQRREGLLYLGVEEARHPEILNTIRRLQAGLRPPS